MNRLSKSLKKIFICFVPFQKKVKKPKSTKYIHHLVTTGTSAGQKVVTLTLDSQQEVHESVTASPKASPSRTVVQSKSSPQLQGAWSNRFIPVPTPEKKGMMYETISRLIIVHVTFSRLNSLSVDLHHLSENTFFSKSLFSGTPQEKYDYVTVLHSKSLKLKVPLSTRHLKLFHRFAKISIFMFLDYLPFKRPISGNF